MKRALSPFLLSLSLAGGLFSPLPCGASPSPEPEPLVLGVMDNVKPTDKQTVVEATAKSFERVFAPRKVIVRNMSMDDIHRAILAGEIDVFISSAGHSYRLQRKYGVRVLGSLASPGYPDPNRMDSSAVIALADRTDIDSLSSLKGMRLAVNSKTSYTGWQIPMGEFAKITSGWEKYFSRVTEVGGGERIAGALDAVLSGEADAAFAKNCYLEAWEALHPEKKGLLKVVGRQDAAGEPCRRSTELYPSWTVTATQRMPPDEVRRAMAAVFSMPPDANGNYWSAATDFVHIDRLFRTLRIGPYEYLREWTVKRALERYWAWALFAVLGVLALAGHSWRTGYLVKKRTAELRALMEKEAKLQKKAREATEHLEHLQKMGALGQVSGMLAHEMRQPLAVISFYLQGLQLLIERGAVGPREKLDGPVSEIERQTKRADAIVEHVRSYAKNSRKGARRKPLLLSDVISETVSNYKVSRQNPPAVKEELESGVWVLADPLEIECAVFNLLKNAGEALGGTENPQIAVKMEKKDGGALVAVEDNGPAMSDEAFAKLLVPAESSKAEGLGLGLSIVRSLVEAYGGQLAFERRPEGGLRASFTIAGGPEPKEKEEEA